MTHPTRAFSGSIINRFTGSKILARVGQISVAFPDGNKRIAATPFLWFMNNNGILYNPDGSKRIGDNTLVALTLMIAESRTEEKDTMVKVVVNLINKKNV